MCNSHQSSTNRERIVTGWRESNQQRKLAYSGPKKEKLDRDQLVVVPIDRWSSEEALREKREEVREKPGGS